MALPEFNDAGDLPVGIHRATLEEIAARFGDGASQRRATTRSLAEICRLAQATHKLDRLVFGSYVTAKLEPDDVDIILVMRDDFDMRVCDEATKPLFEHRQAEHRFGASVFWIRPAMLCTNR